jgi:hypothetical protein
MSYSLPTRLALALAGAGLGTAGATLVMRASWLALAQWLTPLLAHALLGTGLLAVAAVTLVLARRRPPPEPAPLVAVFTAFSQGLAAGRQSQRRKS